MAIATRNDADEILPAVDLLVGCLGAAERDA
jgi:hypothetical protein